MTWYAFWPSDFAGLLIALVGSNDMETNGAIAMVAVIIWFSVVAGAGVGVLAYLIDKIFKG